MTDITQSPIQFGRGDSLMGMLTAPAQGDTLPVACLLFNMGANHRVGPHRINVKLAHALARRGMASLRFDLGGLGDSGSSSTGEHFATQAVFDCQAAMDMLGERLGIHRFVMVGLCSGAVNAMSTAVADARVVGISMFDGYAFPERRSRWERGLRRLIAAPTNAAFIGKTARWLQRRFYRGDKDAQTAHIFDEVDPPEVTAALFARSMTQLDARDVAVQAFYSGTVHVVDRDRDQLGRFAREPFTQRVEYVFDPEVDHTVSTMRAQSLFTQVVGDWAVQVANARGQTTRAPVFVPASAARPYAAQRSAGSRETLLAN